MSRWWRPSKARGAVACLSQAFFHFPAFPCLPSLKLLLGSILSAQKPATQDHSPERLKVLERKRQWPTEIGKDPRVSFLVLELNMEQRAGAQAARP